MKIIGTRIKKLEDLNASKKKQKTIRSGMGALYELMNEIPQKSDIARLYSDKGLNT